MVRILVLSRRPWLSEALATWSYGTYVPQPLSAEILVSAAVVVVLPWSTWPIVPTFTCGFTRSNFSLAIVLQPVPYALEKCLTSVSYFLTSVDLLLDQRGGHVGRRLLVLLEFH